MRVFVTGATGYIGSAVVRELLEAGHQVVGLARSDAAAAQITSAGAVAHRGSLDNLDSLRSGASAADGVIHAAFIHEFSDLAAAAEADRLAIEALGTALAGSDRPFVVTSAIGLLSSGRLGTEGDAPDHNSAGAHRIASEETALSLATRGVCVSVVRMPPSVHGEDDHGFVPTLINIARAKGISAYVGDGSNHWSAVHRLDAAHLYRLVLEKGVAGTRYHGVAEEGVQFRELASVIGRRLDLPVVSKASEEAADHFGWFARFAVMDIPASSQRTREALGWNPKEIGLIADVDRPSYFKI